MARCFIRLHHAAYDRAAIVAWTFDPDFEALARRIDSVLASQPQMTGQLVRVNRPAV